LLLLRVADEAVVFRLLMRRRASVAVREALDAVVFT